MSKCFFSWRSQSVKVVSGKNLELIHMFCLLIYFYFITFNKVSCFFYCLILYRAENFQITYSFDSDVYILNVDLCTQVATEIVAFCCFTNQAPEVGKLYNLNRFLEKKKLTLEYYLTWYFTWMGGLEGCGIACFSELSDHQPVLWVHSFPIVCVFWFKYTVWQLFLCIPFCSYRSVGFI